MRLGNDALDEVRRRVQNQTLGHRGRTHDPLYRARKLLVSASENITDSGRVRLRGLLDAGDPTARSATPGTPKRPCARSMTSPTPTPARPPSSGSPATSRTPGLPTEINRLGRTLWRWRTQISNWHAARVTNAATEAAILWSVSGGVVDVADGHVAGGRGRVLWSVSLESAMLLAA